MRTTLDLDDELLAALQAQYPDLSKTDAIEAAVRAHLAQSAIAELRKRAGTFDIEDVSAEFRAIDRTS